MGIRDIALSQPATTSSSDALLSITTGHSTLATDPQSGSIMKLLGENGFQTKIEQGIKNGHTYTIIHNPPSTEFVLIDNWSEGETPRKAYYAFTVKTTQTKEPTKSLQTSILPINLPSPATILDELEQDLDDFLQTSQQFA